MYENYASQNKFIFGKTGVSLHFYWVIKIFFMRNFFLSQQKRMKSFKGKKKIA